MKPALLFLPFLLMIVASSSAVGQNYKKVSFGKQAGEYYLAVEPENDQIKGVLVLFPGFGQPAESIFPETTLPQLAKKNQLLTIALGIGPKLYADDTVINRINKALNHVQASYSFAPNQISFGGFSAGGTIALRYVEYCYQATKTVPTLPKGVFTIDSPVDLFHIWDYFERELDRNFSEVGTAEAQFVKNRMYREIGSPEENTANYEQLTPFNMNKKGYGNELYLKKVAVRVYHDLDVNWLIRERNRSIRDTNAYAASELINRLYQLGNKQAQFMHAQKPGYRSNGERHPHSWSIVNEKELIEWINSLFTS